MRRERHLTANLRNANKDLAFADADRVVDADIWVKPDVKLGHRPLWVKCSKGLLVKSANLIG